MKLGNPPNYLVQVSRNGGVWDPPELSALYDGIWTVTLNATLSVTFVPHVDRDDPPWPVEDGLPADPFTVPAQVRWFELTTGSLSVTPDAARAGTVEQFDAGEWKSTVWYVTPAEFAAFVTDLDALDDVIDQIQLRDDPARNRAHRDDVLGFAVMRFVDGVVLGSSHLTEVQASTVGRTRTG